MKTKTRRVKVLLTGEMGKEKIVGTVEISDRDLHHGEVVLPVLEPFPIAQTFTAYSPDATVQFRRLTLQTCLYVDEFALYESMLCVKDDQLDDLHKVKSFRPCDPPNSKSYTRILSRETVADIIHGIKRMSDYPWHHTLSYLLEHDEAQRQEIERLKKGDHHE